MWTLQPLQTSLSVSLMAVILITFLSDRHIWVHDNNVELHILTNSEVTFSTYLLQITTTKIPPATTTMNLETDSESIDESFATALDGDLVSESNNDEYSGDERNKDNEEGDDDDDDDDDDYDDDEVEGEVDNTVPEELSSPVRPFVMPKKHSRNRGTPVPPPPRPLPTGSTTVPPPPPPSGASTSSTKRTSTKQKYKTPRSRRSAPSMSSVIQPSTKKVYRVGGVSIVCKNKAANTNNIAVATFKEADRGTMTVCNKNSLITMISSNQQIKFKNLSIATTELEKLDKTHSLKLLITELKTNLACYDLLTAFTIIKCINFNTGQIKIDSTIGEAKDYDLFTDYCQLPPSDVAKLNQCTIYISSITYGRRYELDDAILQEQC